MLKKVIIGAVSLILFVAIYADSLPTPEQNDEQTSAVAQSAPKQGFGSSLFGSTPSSAAPQSSNVAPTEEGIVKIRTADEVVQQHSVEPSPSNGDGAFGQPMISPAPTLPNNQTDSEGLVNGEMPSDSEF